MSQRFARPTQLAGLLGYACLSWASQAHAFSDEERFAEPAAKGGGGGRYFTGSTIDGFGCGVCHRGASAPSVAVRGLPDDFVAGTTYDVEIAWDNPVLSHSLTLELVTPDNLAAGTLALPEEAALSPLARCKSLATEKSAATVFADNGRQVLSVRDCGASIVRFRWTAPQAAEVTFAAGIVRSDASATPDGDGVVEVSRALLPVGASREASGGCHVTPAGTPERGWLAGLMVSLAIALRLRRRDSHV